ncbi:sirohydrochlorin cobaltochelatase [Anaerobium acetethylicum]|uniref:Sirohydrochlorin cobaltochelatase n=1 Tax=Anaerobium acetethylicum TaxID=1619234 RepID=A0A1D3TXN2_9FIRM|nr:sirohydrochlorin cobaltochelatase [Anaerobium acetethylicum]SCP99094.1 sirohydrochlorin cobaltochelatase [Anaerobium acetethylicum]
MDEKNKAIIIAGHGTAHAESPAYRPDMLKSLISERYPDYLVIETHTSPKIISSLSASGTPLSTVTEILSSLESRHFEEVILLSAHLIPGLTYEEFRALILPFRDRFPRFAYTLPLLSSKEDMDDMVTGILSEFSALPADTALLFMGHGSGSSGNGAYRYTSERFRSLPGCRIFLETMNSHSLEPVMEELEIRGIRRIILAPFMMVSGVHARRDMAGDGPGSWKSILEAHGYSVSVLQKGLGDYGFVQRMLLDRLFTVQFTAPASELFDSEQKGC